MQIRLAITIAFLMIESIFCGSEIAQLVPQGRVGAAPLVDPKELGACIDHLDVGARGFLCLKIGLDGELCHGLHVGGGQENVFHRMTTE